MHSSLYRLRLRFWAGEEFRRVFVGGWVDRQTGRHAHIERERDSNHKQPQEIRAPLWEKKTAWRSLCLFRYERSMDCNW